MRERDGEGKREGGREREVKSDDAEDCIRFLVRLTAWESNSGASGEAESEESKQVKQILGCKRASAQGNARPASEHAPCMLVSPILQPQTLTGDCERTKVPRGPELINS